MKCSEWRLSLSGFAARAGIGVSTLSAYISRRHPRRNPPPAACWPAGAQGPRQWCTAHVDAWLASRRH